MIQGKGSLHSVALTEMGVSRETFERLMVLDALVQKWSRRINLVSKASLSNLWERHILDSAQIWKIGGLSSGHWVDLGSGGGFPGLVIAAMAGQSGSNVRVTLIESDERKVEFLRTAARAMEVQLTVICERIETAEPQAADIVSARALSALDSLCGYGSRHGTAISTFIFPKGRQYRAEIEEARKSWSFSLETVPSMTDKDAAVLVLRDIAHV